MIALAHALRAADVKRWHIVNTARLQTLAEHHFMVAIIGRYIAAAFAEKMNAPIFDNHVDEDLFNMALLEHDITEVYTGDTPTPGKDVLRTVANMPDLFERASEVYNNYPGLVLAENYQRIIKMADLMADWVFLKDNFVGARAELIFGDLTSRIYKYVDQCQKELSGWPWRATMVSIMNQVENVHV